MPKRGSKGFPVPEGVAVPWESVSTNGGPNRTLFSPCCTDQGMWQLSLSWVLGGGGIQGQGHWAFSLGVMGSGISREAVR